MKLKWGDFIVFGFVAMITIAMFIGGVTKKTTGTLIAQVFVEGEMLYEINLEDLNEDKEILFHEGDIRIIAKKDRIRFEKSDCPDLVCVNTGWLKRQGQIAACIPNKILIKIVGSDDEVDVVLH